ncbi:hypothetical protein GOP47_0006642 [Adiantum capillus-veneris]|uniref:Uncharacterized protein n=1 Tax=Adiantum capillus-veneris TaxID=13818 RepID=A0A9D4ZMP1_ADICA|nr:hypothetical protein GOP47_0006642 [Adiantum capillus-veneris]
MFKQDHALQSKTDAVAHDDLRHILIPACELGPERYQEFRAAKPHWRPRSYVQPSGDEVLGFCEGCHECMASSTKPPNAKPQLTVDCSGLSKVAKPISISVQRLNNHQKIPMAENIASFHAIHSPVVIKATQQYANNGVVLEETAISKPIPPVKRGGREVSPTDDMEQTMKSNLGEDHTEHVDSGRIKFPNFRMIHATTSDHATSSEDLSEDTMTPPQMEAMSFSADHAACGAQGDAMASVKVPKCTDGVRLDEPIFVEDEDLFKYVLATRQIPYGHSYSNLDIAMQRRLHDYFKQSCPPCPHCNSNTYVKFRYFNNSGKSSLLQPRYSCRNPDTCLTIQEKTGKAGSRDFTLPKPKEADNGRAPMLLATHERADGQRGRSARQPQMIPRCGSKRVAHNLNPLSEAAERCAKLPNTTLSLQTMNGPGLVDATNLQIVEASKAKSLQSVKHAEDSISSSSTRTASDEKTAINVRCQAVESAENGRLVVQPISIQQVGSTSGKAEAGSVDRHSKGGRIAELNICMYIDLSTAS